MVLPATHPARSPVLEAHLLGQVDYDACLHLQQRLVSELSGQPQGPGVLLICEHAPLITIGRNGSRAHIAATPEELTSAGVPVRFVNRGGGCVLHAPGNLAIYPILPLANDPAAVGTFVEQFQRGLQAALAEQGIYVQPRHLGSALAGRTGHLVSLGLAVKHWTTYHGAFVQVAPPLALARQIRPTPEPGATWSSLTLERQQLIRLQKLREAIVRHCADAWNRPRVHWYTGHPLLSHTRYSTHEAAARVG